MKDIVIAFDGHSSCGKSTVAKAVAKQLNYTFIDSGAMYRAVTFLAIKKKLISGKVIKIEKLKTELNSIDIKFVKNNITKKQETFLNDENIEKEIRGIEVSDSVSYISELDFVRAKLVALQQKMGVNKRIVMDGRDIGTVVFPNAELKFFMTASVEIRAQRRYKELTEKGDKVTFEEIRENIEKRDYIDQNREISPLKKADDAIILDNSNLSREEQLTWVMKRILDYRT
ncbi:MAG: (d)CMP kinase [Bacteroidetes bacterium]|nr:MAG: (d)CMP kinase [Bacteroidota bacterium]